MDVMEAILTRRSIRSFTNEPVSDDTVRDILAAAMAAPSAGNEQPWRFVVVRDAETLRRLSRSTPFAKPLDGAAVGLVVCADKRALKYPGFWPIDCAAAIQNALLAAHSAGLGGVWIGVHPIKPLGLSVARVMKLPRHIRPMSLLALGRPAERKPPAQRYEQRFVHNERWEGDAGGSWPTTDGAKTVRRQDHA